MEALNRDRSTLAVVNHAVDVRRARGEAVEATKVLGVIDGPIKILLSHLEESSGCQQAITTCLVLLADSADLKVVRNVLKAALQSFAAPHEELDVVDAWEPDTKEGEEVCFLCWQRTTCHHLEQVAKVVTAVTSRREESSGPDE